MLLPYTPVTDDRYKQLMEQVGLPNSMSLLQAFKQLENEVVQQMKKDIMAGIREDCKDQFVETMGYSKRLSRCKALIEELLSQVNRQCCMIDEDTFQKLTQLYSEL